MPVGEAAPFANLRNAACDIRAHRWPLLRSRTRSCFMTEMKKLEREQTQLDEQGQHR
ncbi:MAG: hypothetical protein R2940_14045 [Syntrophotaleaceae bacterium]